MTLYNIFNTFEEAKAAQEYDYNLFRAKKFSEATGISLDIILSENLHIDQAKRHRYYLENEMVFNDEQKKAIHNTSNNFFITNRWANICSYNDAFVYPICPLSDALNNTIDIDILNSRLLVSLNDDGICIAATDWE